MITNFINIIYTLKNVTVGHLTVGWSSNLVPVSQALVFYDILRVFTLLK